MAKLIYLATPYSKYVGGTHEAFLGACLAATILRARHNGTRFYSPIQESHPIAIDTDIDRLDANFWISFNRPIMDRCDELWIVEMPGWMESKGIAAEADIFAESGRPRWHVSWPDLILDKWTV